jgi:hypothetical protein
MKWKGDKTNRNVHKYFLKVAVQNLAKVFHQNDEFAAFWCEISTDRGFLKSELIEMQKLEGHRFCFPLETDIEKDVIFRLYACKGLKDSLVGQIQFRRPETG